MKILKKYSHLWVVSLMGIYLLWFFYLEANIKAGTGYTIIHTSFDDRIPFNEYFVIPYFFWFIYTLGLMIFLFFKDKEEFLTYAFTLAIGAYLCLFICTVFPNGTDLRPRNLDYGKNVFTQLIYFLHRVDTPTNILPSMHVYISLVSHLCIVDSKYFKNKIWHILSFITMLSVLASTLFLKQHSIVDVLAAITLFFIIYHFYYLKIRIPKESKEEAFI